MKTIYTLIFLSFTLFTGSIASAQVINTVYSGPGSNSQITKGTGFLGGSVTFQSQSDKSGFPPSALDTNKSSALSLAPSYSWAISGSTVIGFRLIYTNQHYDQSASKQTSNSNSYGAGIFLRNYRYLGERFSIFGESAVRFAYTNGTADVNSGTPGQHTKTTGYYASLGFSPGLAYSISPHWQIEAEFPNVIYANYTHANSTSHGLSESQDISNNFAIGSSFANSFTLGIGLLYVIGKK